MGHRRADERRREAVAQQPRRRGLGRRGQQIRRPRLRVVGFEGDLPRIGHEVERVAQVLEDGRRELRVFLRPVVVVAVAAAELVREGGVLHVEPQRLAARLEAPLHRQHVLAHLAIQGRPDEPRRVDHVRVVVVVHRRVAPAALLLEADAAGAILGVEVARVLDRCADAEPQAREPEVDRLVEELVEHVLAVGVGIELVERRLGHGFPAMDHLEFPRRLHRDGGLAGLMAVREHEHRRHRQGQQRQQQRRAPGGVMRHGRRSRHRTARISAGRAPAPSRGT
ncbi:MAG: hypothetical protein U0P30_06045 [Vicinamibacterales bacterium]